MSWSMAAWRVYLAGVLCLVAVLGLLAMSAAFLTSYPHLRNMERERDALQDERDALRDQILSANQKFLDAKEGRFVRARMVVPRGREGPQPNGGGERQASEYLPPFQIDSARTKVNRKKVEVAFRIVNQGGPSNNRGGFLFAVFANLDTEPNHFIASPTVAVNRDGFPGTYKSGIRFPRVRKPVTYRRSVRRLGPGEYFTHVTLYLFSLRGGLLLKEIFELDRDLFRGEGPSAKTQELLKT